MEKVQAFIAINNWVYGYVDQIKKKTDSPNYYLCCRLCGNNGPEMRRYLEINDNMSRTAVKNEDCLSFSKNRIS